MNKILQARKSAKPLVLLLLIYSLPLPLSLSLKAATNTKQGPAVEK